MSILNILLEAHSGLRWIIILVAIIIAIRSILVWVGTMSVSKVDATLMRVYSAVLGIQVLLGLIYLVWSGIEGAGLPWYRIAHAVVMIVAVGVAGASRRFAGEGRLTGRNNLLVVIATLVLIFVGVALLPGGWAR